MGRLLVDSSKSMSQKSKPDTVKKPTDEALATLMLDRQERVERCGKALAEILKTERCRLDVRNLLIVDGRIVPQIQIVAID
jgi:hypothetical protein